MQNIEKRKERRKKKVGALEKAVLNNSVQHQMNYFVNRIQLSILYC